MPEHPWPTPPLPPPAHALAFAVETPPFSAEFRSALLATHEGTRDCPELNGGRTPDELLAGFGDPAPGDASYLATAGGTAVALAFRPGSRARPNVPAPAATRLAVAINAHGVRATCVASIPSSTCDWWTTHRLWQRNLHSTSFFIATSVLLLT